MADTVRRWFEVLLERIGLRRPVRRNAESGVSDAIYPLW